MAGTREAVDKPRKSNGGPDAASPGSGPASDVFAFTFDVSAGKIITVEKVDSSGARRELTEADKAILADTPQPSLEAIVEQAFEAGIACVLGDYATRDEDSESNDEAEERRLLLAPLMERAGAHGLLERNLLGRALLATAIQQATAPHAASPEAGQPQHGSGAPANGPRPAAQKNAGLERNQRT